MIGRRRGYRAGENPARWRGHLDRLLPARSKVRKVEHHAALPYSELPGFLAALRKQEGIAARALEFTRWDEINWTDKIWIIAGTRMKSGREHRVPLCDRALAILREMRPAMASMPANNSSFQAAKPAGRSATWRF